MSWWGGVAYWVANGSPLDWSDGEMLRFQVKADSAMQLAVALWDGTSQSGTGNVSVGTDYSEVSVPFSAFTDVDLSKITGIVFAYGASVTANHVVDIDDISLTREVYVPTPEPSPIKWETNVDPNNPSTTDKKFRGVQVVDRDYLMIHFVDGEVLIDETANSSCLNQSFCGNPVNQVVSYGKPLNTDAATTKAYWHITSADDEAYGLNGATPLAAHRKSKLNGMAQKEWVSNDYRYDHTMEHWIYLELPHSLVQGKTYALQVADATNTDINHWTFTYDIYNSRSEAIHVNLAGYHPNSAAKAADLSIWMGDGGGRNYSSFEGNAVYLYNVDTKQAQQVGTVSFGQSNKAEAQNYNFFRSDVWHVDFDGTYPAGNYRLAIDGVGTSQDFVIGEQAVNEPFRISTLGFYYMRIGEQPNPNLSPVPRQPLWLPGESPSNTRIVITDMDPYHPNWEGGGDRWDQPDFFANYVKPGKPENPNAKGGHSDALDWDRHLGHVSIIYDMLLPYIITDGAINSDNLGIAESGNGIPDIIDEARNEVDFWLSLRYQGGYSHGLTNPNSSTNTLYQADNTAIAAWANALNAATLAEALRIAGLTTLKNEYIAAAEEAWNYASSLSDQMLDETQGLGGGEVPGRDFRVNAAAWLYNLTGNTVYEDILNNESMITSGTSAFLTSQRDQLYALAAYLHTDQPVHYQSLQNNMRDAAIYQAKHKETQYAASRPSRRSTDNNLGYFHTSQFVLRSILAHSVATTSEDKAHFQRALELEADWSLGRNPANMIQMTTSATELADKRSVENCYTSGGWDGVPGMHPGHTPYFNIDDWGSMIMAKPNWMVSKVYPGGNGWPRSELYFNTRYVWAHSEFTPQQTMRGKAALYGYLAGMNR